jgi:hypothetical protein
MSPIRGTILRGNHTDNDHQHSVSLHCPLAVSIP